ncbi:4-(cytidine 5'-diphospho)-2-C-methyl-D-erythritol kinase [Brooklawnia cerclae]|uniref:4-(cytidine 5'-diphospho)-2-C-methyl-D-erythritol kinase n=1 Tax=Brooklawnia cerclae TaxID=349934 RepID=UPI0035E7EC76
MGVRNPSSPVVSQRIHVRVPAKINLALCVGSRRVDGFHDLSTVFHAVSLWDDVVAVGRRDGRITLTMSGEGSELLPCDETNLAVRAALLLREQAGEPGLGADLRIEKRVPLAGGMAGGSADAAGALVACARLWGLDVPPGELLALGAQLGSDVPFSLLGGNALGRGRGERLHPLAGAVPLHWVVAAAPDGLSTPAVYRRFDELTAHDGLVPDSGVPTDLIAALESGDPREVAPLLRNDLQAAAVDLHPGLAATLDAGLAVGALAGIVSGSGPTCVFLCADERHAGAVAGGLSSARGVRAVQRVTGPVPGPCAAALPVARV